MTRNATVYLGEQRVGRLQEGSDGFITFTLDPDYLLASRRPILSQYTEEHNQPTRGKHPRDLPAFFQNLLPERNLETISPLHTLLTRTFKLEPGDQLGLLLCLGEDLPGAVRVLAEEHAPERPEAPHSGHTDDATQLPEPGGLRFSLAGVQIKFSMVQQGLRWALPLRGEEGHWIVKLSTNPGFEQVVENEHSVMAWARSAGFEVPTCHIARYGELDGLPERYLPPEATVFCIQRYDRTPAGRVHQEDLCQALNIPPGRKYTGVNSYERLALVAQALLGPEGLEEYLRRLALIVATGNGDAHLKNWSLLYRDPRRAAWAPLYDQVATVAWPDVSSQLAFKLDGARKLREVTPDALRLFAARYAAYALRSGLEPLPAAAVEDLFSNTLETLRDTWARLADDLAFAATHKQALREHWRRTPLLARHGPLA